MNNFDKDMNENTEIEYPEFDQEEYDKIFEDMYIEKTKLEENLKNLSFKEFPAGIKKQIYAHIFIMIFATIIFGYLIYTAFKTNVGFKITGLFFYFILIFYLLLRTRIIYLTAEIKEFVVFSGVVLNVERKGFLQNKYYLIKATDGDKIINFKYTGDKAIKKGLPVSIYIDKYADIKRTEEGLMVDYILGIEFSDIDHDLTNEDLQNLKAGDYFQ